MHLNEYQRLAQRTANTRQMGEIRLAVAGLGISGEAGEVSELIKKVIGHGHPLDSERVKKELGDVLWYVAEIAEIYGLTLAEVAEANINKLRARYPEGFSAERSLNRAPGDT